MECYTLLTEGKGDYGDKSNFTTFSKYYIHRPYSFEPLTQVM